MNLRPQDVVVVLKLASLERVAKRWTYAEVSKDLFLSQSQVFRSVQRAEEARLLNAPTLPPEPRPSSFAKEEGRVFLSPNNSNLLEFLIHGVKYAFPVEHGSLTRGIPTAEAAPPLSHYFGEDFSHPPVWPHATGSVRGMAFSPLYRNVPQAATRDRILYEMLALVDAIREGRAREREIAIRELELRIAGKKVSLL